MCRWLPLDYTECCDAKCGKVALETQEHFVIRDLKRLVFAHLGGVSDLLSAAAKLRKYATAKHSSCRFLLYLLLQAHHCSLYFEYQVSSFITFPIICKELEACDIAAVRADLNFTDLVPDNFLFFIYLLAKLQSVIRLTIAVLNGNCNYSLGVRMPLNIFHKGLL